jgi:L-serine/L-threonine ammonia-lyase
MMIDRIRATGAEVVIHGSMWVEADAYLRNVLIKQLPKDVEAVYLHPFEGQTLWEGHSTMVDEFLSQLPNGVKPDAVVVSVGGGGLYSGVATGMIRNGLADVPIVAVETEGSNCFNESLKAGKQVVLKKLNSIATSLGSTYVSEETLDLARRQSTKSILVTDEDCMRACIAFADDHRIVVEPACGATLAVGYQSKLKDVLPDLSRDSNVVFVVCGGSATTVDNLGEYNRYLGL